MDAAARESHRAWHASTWVHRSGPLSASFDADVLVIGSGFGGSVAALRFAEKGYRVIVVEKGKRWAPGDFPRTNWNLPKSFWMPRLGCSGTWSLKLLRDVLVIHGVGVGGGSLLYANTHLEAPPEVWDDAQWRGLEPWRAEMPEHYATARRMLGSTTNPRLGPADAAIRHAAERRGFGDSWRPTQVGIFFGEPDATVDDPYFGGKGPRRTGCTFCGGCMTGCHVGAKNTLDRNYLYLAEQLGARVIPETEVEGLEPLPGGGYRAQWRSSTTILLPERGTFTARRVVVAAGVLGTLSLLLECKRRGSLPNLSDTLGTLVRTNSEALLGLTSRTRTDLTEGIAITSSARMDAVTHMEPVRFRRGNDVMLLLGTPLVDGGPGVPRALRWVLGSLRHPGRFLFAARPWGKAERSVVLLVMQSKESATRLHKNRTWYAPFRRTLVSRAPAGAPRIPSYLPIANDVAREVAKELDAVPQSALNEALLDIPTTAHLLGGCPIGASDATGVVDSSGRVFGHEGLYVMDGSVIGANLGVNPSLTITALAELACSRIPALQVSEAAA